MQLNYKMKSEIKCTYVCAKFSGLIYQLKFQLNHTQIFNIT